MSSGIPASRLLDERIYQSIYRRETVWEEAEGSADDAGTSFRTTVPHLLDAQTREPVPRFSTNRSDTDDLVRFVERRMGWTVAVEGSEGSVHVDVVAGKKGVAQAEGELRGMVVCRALLKAAEVTD